MKWKNIKTAPKDGTLVLLYGKSVHNYSAINVGYYHYTISIGNYGPWRWPFTFQPSHWMPLPKPPIKS